MADVWRAADFRRRDGESAVEWAARLAGRDPSALTPQAEAPRRAAGPDSQAIGRCKASIRALTAEDKTRLAKWFGDGMRG